MQTNVWALGGGGWKDQAGIREVVFSSQQNEAFPPLQRGIKQSTQDNDNMKVNTGRPPSQSGGSPTGIGTQYGLAEARQCHAKINQVPGNVGHQHRSFTCASQYGNVSRVREWYSQRCKLVITGFPRWGGGHTSTLAPQRCSKGSSRVEKLAVRRSCAGSMGITPAATPCRPRR